MEAHGPGPVKILIAASLASALLLACLSNTDVFGARAAETKQEAISVSLPDLLADKQRYKGQLVKITGYIAIGREIEMLAVNEEEANTLTGDPKKSVWLNLSAAQHERYRRFSRTYGVVTGRFRTSDCEGHLCLFGGSLDEVAIRSR